MKKRLVFALTAGVGVLGLLAVPAVQAQSIGVKFASDEPISVSSTPPSGLQWPASGSALDPKDVAPSAANGVSNYPQGNWNNVQANSGLQPNLVEDGTPLGTGVAVNTTAQVVWFASNTWASTGKGEENNNFTGTPSVNYPGEGADAVLMAGYLDMNQGFPEATFIQFTNLPVEISTDFGVYIYAVPGVPGRGGIYSVNTGGGASGVNSTSSYQYYVASGIQDTTKQGTQGLFSGPQFVQAIGDDNSFGANGSQDDFGNYLYFPTLSGTTVTITAIDQAMPSLPGYNGTMRAPIAAVQLVAGQ
jgi:hypothetical protein